MHRPISDEERLNLASDYIYGREREAGPPALSFDEYIMLVRSIAQFARSYTDESRMSDREVDEILSRLDAA